jgi:hypothetical protein
MNQLRLEKADLKSLLNSEQNQQSEDILKREMRNKVNYSQAYYATNKTVKNIRTDFDNFPYNRWYRGIASNSTPVIIEREAGYRNVKLCKPADKTQYALTTTGPMDSSENRKDHLRVLALNGFLGGSQALSLNHCFEAAPSTVYPCYSNTDDYNASKFAVRSSGQEVKYGVVISP